MNATQTGAGFGVCSMCRKRIAYGTRYVRCSVTACNMGKIKLLFCSPGCWDAHLPIARHRKAAFVEEVAPATADP